MEFFSRTVNTSTCIDTHTDRPPSISASSAGHQCYSRQYNLRFTFCLKTTLQLLLNTLRPKNNKTPTQQTGRRLLNSWWYSMTFQGRCVFFILFNHGLYFINAVALCFCTRHSVWQELLTDVVGVMWYMWCMNPNGEKITFHFKDVCQKSCSGFLVSCLLRPKHLKDLTA